MSKLALCLCVLMIAGGWLSGCDMDRESGLRMRLTPMGLPDERGQQVYDVFIVDYADPEPNYAPYEARRRKWLDIAMTTRGVEYEVLSSNVISLGRFGMFRVENCEFHYTVKARQSQDK